ncbi:dipeptidyl aminopeptidase ASCRUDRAFT_76349 [Ascoidea rubescens DSM 1968]|uniref:Dipeptidyl aminopeptidase B n=1 Tax=Ascoidea rubescens DSM 1968 TaxID=1344418 RepID=A0A1D2VFH3_9ASCO|nr:hypothetical protein ASCRUDRAFT_76349 [Ascoidea rubescens DSM 1968]ODV60349.1 hypothetical protein ASCRUDRAFT_76349 [Ascoidea rubescens DSM 1968]
MDHSRFLDFEEFYPEEKHPSLFEQSHLSSSPSFSSISRLSPAYLAETQAKTRKDKYQKIIIFSSLLSLIIWGSFFLIRAISFFYQDYNSSSFLLNQNPNDYSNLKRQEILINEINYDLFSENKVPSLLFNENVINESDFQANSKNQLSLNLIRNGTFSPDFKSFQWISSNETGTYLTKENNSYVIKKINNDSYANILYNNTYFIHQNINYTIDDLIASPNFDFALIQSNRTKQWRHSSFSIYWLLDINSLEITPIYDDSSKISVINWSPDLVHLSFVLDNNLYIKNILSGQVTQLTFDGNHEIFYGKPDWVYEEEVFENDFAMWWSPNGDYLTFMKTNDTFVPQFPIPYFVQRDNQNYPDLVNIKYPKAGASNPIVSMMIYNLLDNKLTEISDFKHLNDPLITEVTWVGTKKFLLRVTNRSSDLLKSYVINADSNTSYLVRSEDASKDGGWFEITQDTIYVPADSSKGRPHDGYIDVIVHDGYDHLAYFSPPESLSPKKILTKGEWEVTNGVSAFDPDNNLVYFLATKRSSIERHLYSVDLNGQNFKSISNDNEHGWYSSSFSKDSKYLLLNYNGPKVPYQKLINLSSNKNNSTEKDFDSIIITNNNDLSKTLSKFDIPRISFNELNLGKDENNNDIIVNSLEIKPPNFDPSKKYPLLFYVYGGPISQLVQQRFSIGFSHLVSAQLNSIVVTVDGRGTGYKGRDFRSIVRNNLGYYEVVDQLSAAKIYTQKSYIDSERTAIWGWSYGGFMTLKTLEHDTEQLFKYGISVAPVTDWAFYDSIYTERYMHTPQDNSDGYFNASIGNFNITNFQTKKRFLVCHGTGDDNVHFQNFLKFVDNLNLNSIENNFDMMVFPDSDHSINHHNGNKIIFNKILWWLKMAFNGEFDGFNTYNYHNEQLLGNNDVYYNSMGYHSDDDEDYSISAL